MTLNITIGLMEQVGDLAKRAGIEIMKIYNSDFQVDTKDDASPVTEADRIAEDLITKGIREGITASFPVIGEEAVAVVDVELDSTDVALILDLSNCLSCSVLNGELRSTQAGNWYSTWLLILEHKLLPCSCFNSSLESPTSGYQQTSAQEADVFMNLHNLLSSSSSHRLLDTK